MEVRSSLLAVTAIISLLFQVGFPNCLLTEEQSLKDAWQRLNKGQYEAAIRFAEACIVAFREEALREQHRLEKDKAPIPPTGSVGEAEKKKALKRDLLNDVATAYWIRVRAAEYLFLQAGKNSHRYKTTAKESYQEACRFYYGRTWDPKGFFWPPCKAATNRLEDRHFCPRK